MMLASLSVRLDGTPGGGVGGAGARKGASFGLASQPFVRGGGAGGRRQRRGPGPLGPGADLRRRRQLEQGRQQRTGGRAAYRGYPLVAAGAARRAWLRDIAGSAAAAFSARYCDSTAIRKDASNLFSSNVKVRFFREREFAPEFPLILYIIFYYPHIISILYILYYYERYLLLLSRVIHLIINFFLLNLRVELIFFNRIKIV